MAGRGVVEAQDKQPIPRVYMLTKEMEWKPAVDPLHTDKPAVAGVGLARSFARELLKSNPSAAIGLIPAAFGGTSLDEWKPGDKLYNDAVARARFAMKSGKLRGILWHQGEADSSKEENAKTYRERLAKVIGSLREDLNAPELPVVLGQLGEFLEAPFAGAVNEQLAIAPLRLSGVAFVNSHGLKPKSDNVHFDSAALREFADALDKRGLLLQSVRLPALNHFEIIESFAESDSPLNAIAGRVLFRQERLGFDLHLHLGTDERRHLDQCGGPQMLAEIRDKGRYDTSPAISPAMLVRMIDLTSPPCRSAHISFTSAVSLAISPAGMTLFSAKMWRSTS